MTSEFKPKITYRMAGFYMATNRPKTPWQYLEDWEMSDRDPNTSLDTIALAMQTRWPGKYQIVVKEIRHPEHMYKYSKWVIEFDNPAEETMFRLKYS